MAGTFSRLSPELLIIILRHVPDLPSLYKLICASAKANAAFEIDPSRILDQVVERSIPGFKHLARMVAILGSLSTQISPHEHSENPPSRPTFETLVNKYKQLPEDVLTLAPPSFAFAAGTPGPRYLLLTAYRIENLRHICIVTLLQNIHEYLFSSPMNGKTEKEPGRTLKQFRPGVSFKPAAWWSPSWVERFRVERALWKLIIYWNIRAIDPDLATDDPGFHQYNARLRHISSSIGPEMPERPASYSHEPEEMSCISVAVQEFLDCESLELFTTFYNQVQKSQIRKAWSKSCAVLEETINWNFEEPKPLSSWEAIYWGQWRDAAFRLNSLQRSSYWSSWHLCVSHSKLKLKNRDIHFPDYLGLCLWDCKRLVYLGLAHIKDKYLDPCLGHPYSWHPRQSYDIFYSLNIIRTRWQKAFLQELVRLPGGQWHPLSKDCKQLIRRWEDYVYEADRKFDLWWYRKY